jgi:hypothetical protein
MRAHSDVNGTKTWTSPNGELKVWKAAPHVIVVRFQGAMFDGHLAHLAMLEIEGHAARHKLDIFHDWEGMDLYATEARTLMTERAIPIAARISSLNVLFDSKVVRMGVSMANLKLGGIRMFTTREEFEQVIQQAVNNRPT